jgi:hypothetical protein
MLYHRAVDVEGSGKLDAQLKRESEEARRPCGHAYAVGDASRRLPDPPRSLLHMDASPSSGSARRPPPIAHRRDHHNAARSPPSSLHSASYWPTSRARCLPLRTPAPPPCCRPGEPPGSRRRPLHSPPRLAALRLAPPLLEGARSFSQLKRTAG